MVICKIVLVLAFFVVSSTVVNGQSLVTQGGSLSGVVSDATGAALSDVSVTLLGEDAATRTDSAGHFVLRDITPGSHTVLFRRIGYQSVERRWMSRAGGNVQIMVAMRASAQQLARVVVVAPGATRRRGTSSVGGTVADSTDQPVPDADVRLLGSGLSTTTDSAGRFEFRGLAAGSYVVRARKRGLTSNNYVMQIADDDNRSITTKLYPLASKTKVKDVASASGYDLSDIGYEALDRRLRGRTQPTLLGPADLVRSDNSSLDALLRQYRDIPGTRRRATSMTNAGPGAGDDGDCLLIDGRHAVFQPLRTYSAVRMQLIEVYRTNSFVDDFILTQMDRIRECRGDMNRHPSYFVLWTRSMR